MYYLERLIGSMEINGTPFQLIRPKSETNGFFYLVAKADHSSLLETALHLKLNADTAQLGVPLPLRYSQKNAVLARKIDGMPQNPRDRDLVGTEALVAIDTTVTADILQVSTLRPYAPVGWRLRFHHNPKLIQDLGLRPTQYYQSRWESFVQRVRNDKDLLVATVTITDEHEHGLMKDFLLKQWARDQVKASGGHS